MDVDDPVKITAVDRHQVRAGTGDPQCARGVGDVEVTGGSGILTRAADGQRVGPTGDKDRIVTRKGIGLHDGGPQRGAALVVLGQSVARIGVDSVVGAVDHETGVVVVNGPGGLGIAERGIAGVRQVDDEGLVGFVVGVAGDGDDDRPGGLTGCKCQRSRGGLEIAAIGGAVGGGVIDGDSLQQRVGQSDVEDQVGCATVGFNKSSVI